MNTKSFLLGYGEAALIILMIPFLRHVLQTDVAQMVGREISPTISLLLIIAVAFALLFLITNNVRKRVFAETIVPQKERLIECFGGICALISVILYLSRFA